MSGIGEMGTVEIVGGRGVRPAPHETPIAGDQDGAFSPNRHAAFRIGELHLGERIRRAALALPPTGATVQCGEDGAAAADSPPAIGIEEINAGERCGNTAVPLLQERPHRVSPGLCR